MVTSVVVIQLKYTKDILLMFYVFCSDTTDLLYRCTANNYVEEFNLDDIRIRVCTFWQTQYYLIIMLNGQISYMYIAGISILGS